MKLRNVLLSTKQTTMEIYRSKFLDPRKVLGRSTYLYELERHERHYDSLQHVRRVLGSLGVPYQRVYTPYQAPELFHGRDLAISLGGDGTVLDTAQYMKNSTPLLTVNSDSKKSVGALCTTRAEHFRLAVRKVLDDDFETERWTRIEGRMGNDVELALNDIAVKEEIDSARYWIRLKKGGGPVVEERQYSTGILVSTGAGSTGWYYNVPGSDGQFPKTSREFRYIVREPKKTDDYELSSGVLKNGDSFEVESLMDVGGFVTFDGSRLKRRWGFKNGEKLKVKISDLPLSVVVFPENHHS